MRLFFSLALGAAALAATAVLAQDNYPVPDPSHIVFTPPKDVKWKTGAAMDLAVIFGRPGQARHLWPAAALASQQFQPPAFPQYRPLRLCDFGDLVGEFVRHL